MNGVLLEKKGHHAKQQSVLVMPTAKKKKIIANKFMQLKYS